MLLLIVLPHKLNSKVESIYAVCRYVCDVRICMWCVDMHAVVCVGCISMHAVRGCVYGVFRCVRKGFFMQLEGTTVRWIDAMRG